MKHLLKTSRISTLSFFTLIAFNLNTFATDPHIAVGAKGYKQDCKKHTVIVIDTGFNTEEPALKDCFVTTKYASESVRKSQVLSTFHAKLLKKRKAEKYDLKYLRDGYSNIGKLFTRDQFFSYYTTRTGLNASELEYLITRHEQLSHGTHVSGIIAGKKIGLAKNCKIIPIDTLNRTVDEALFEALLIAKSQKISAVNISLRLSKAKQFMTSERMAIISLLCKETMVFKSAGNYATSYGDDDETRSLIMLANQRKGRFIVCGSLAYDNDQERHSPFSELAGSAEYYIAAPGSNIESCTGLGLIERMSGTSMASPMTIAVYINLLTKLQKEYKDLINEDHAMTVLLASTRQESLNDSVLFSGKQIGKGVVDLGHAIDIAPQILGLDSDITDWEIVRKPKKANKTCKLLRQKVKEQIEQKSVFQRMKHAANYLNPWAYAQ